jgi:hypothetical protein
MIDCVLNGAKQLIIWKDGTIGDNRMDYLLPSYYTNQKPIFGELYHGKKIQGR